MTRFDAATAQERRALVVAALRAHRERGSLFCTVEADGPPGAGDGSAGDGTGDDGSADDDGTARDGAADEATADSADAEPADADEAAPAWIQYSEPEGQLNLDCTDEEYRRLVGVLDDFPAFSVAEQSSPEDADGRNLRIAARGDDERIAQLVDRLFVDGYGYGEDYRLWATEC